MTVTTETLRRLRALTAEPERTPMKRYPSGPPTPGMILNETRQELRRVRQGLSDAVAIIETLLEERRRWEDDAA